MSSGIVGVIVKSNNQCYLCEQSSTSTPKHHHHHQREMISLAKANQILALYFLATHAMEPKGWDSIPPHHGWTDSPKKPKKPKKPKETEWSGASARKSKKKKKRNKRRIAAAELDKSTIFFNSQRLNEIRATCEQNNVRGLRSGQWTRHDGKIHRTGHTLHLARAAELAVATVLRAKFSADPATANWVVEGPFFGNRRGHERDEGDLRVRTDDGILWIEVKSITNHGQFTRHDINKAGRMGYVFQRLKWDFRKRKLTLTPTFDVNHREHITSGENLLVGVVSTPTKGGGVACTISKSVFMKPIHECKWVPLKYASEKDKGLKRATPDGCVV